MNLIAPLLGGDELKIFIQGVTFQTFSKMPGGKIPNSPKAD